MSDTTAPAESAPAPPAESTATPPSASPGVIAPPSNALDIAAMLKEGKLTADQAGKLAKAGNISTLDVAHAMHTLHELNEPKPDADAIKLDEEFGPVGRPEEFVINYFRPGENGVMTAEMKQFDANARHVLVAAGFSREAGNSLVATITRVLHETKDMTEGELDTYRHTELTKLQQAHGDKLTERLALADDMLDDLERQRPGAKAVVMSRAGTNAMVWNVLIAHATGYHARAQAKQAAGR